MLRFRFIVLALLLAAVLRPMPAAAVASPERSGSPVALQSVGALLDPWGLLREWLGRPRTDCGASRDLLGGCTGNAPRREPAAAQRQDRPSARSAGGRFRLDCGASRDPLGGCTTPPPATGSAQARRH
jgi:hypothetical protein